MAFDLHWSSPTSDGTEENLVYRFGSVGQVFSFSRSLSKDKINDRYSKLNYGKIYVNQPSGC